MKLHASKSKKKLFCISPPENELTNQYRYLVRAKFVIPHGVDYSLSILSLAYLTFPEVTEAKERRDDVISADLLNGIYAFYDYASACWAMHLQTGIPNPDAADKLDLLLETVEQFIQWHWSATPKSLPISKKVQEKLSPMAASELYEKICQAVEWSRKQLGTHCQSPSQDEALDLWQATDKIRSLLEGMQSPSLPETERQKLEQFYGRNWFRCPRVSCHYYHEGFESASQKKNHVDRHDRPFLCIFDGCQVKLFGCATKDELKKHVLHWHGIDEFDGKEYPPPAKPQTPSTAKRPATFQCHLCEKKYTGRFNLNSHLRTHEGVKPFACGVCGENFTRKNDRNRHEKDHGDKKYVCFGDLKDGTTWGCKSSYGRADKLADHLRTKTGLNCIRPLLLQKLKEGGEGADGANMLSEELGSNADALLAAGKLLPSFGEFLELCGLDRSVII
jgi:hypothetical protein